MPTDARAKMVDIALRKGACRRGNNNIITHGKYEPYESFAGRKHLHTGVLEFMYYSSYILTVDFIKKRITHHGMRGYSISTDGNIRSWESYIFKLFPYQLPRWIDHEYAYWLDDRCRSYVEEKTGTMFSRFKKRVPWIQREDRGTEWFHWPLFDQVLGDTYRESVTFLTNDQNWRYFDYDWIDGKWTRIFKDVEATRRWHAREARRKRGNGNVSAQI